MSVHRCFTAFGCPMPPNGAGVSDANQKLLLLPALRRFPISATRSLSFARSLTAPLPLPSLRSSLASFSRGVNSSCAACLLCASLRFSAFVFIRVFTSNEDQSFSLPDLSRGHVQNSTGSLLARLNTTPNMDFDNHKYEKYPLILFRLGYPPEHYRIVFITY